jgi:hypothetical protein
MDFPDTRLRSFTDRLQNYSREFKRKTIALPPIKRVKRLPTFSCLVTQNPRYQLDFGPQIFNLPIIETKT